MALTKVTSGGITDSAITSAKINDGAITNDDIKSDAAITAGKLSATLDLSSKTVTLPAASVTAHATTPTLDSPSITGTLFVDDGSTVSHTIGNWSEELTYVITPTNCTVGAVNSSGVFVVTHTSGNPSYTIVATTDSLGLDNSSTVTKNIVMNLSAPTLSSPADVGTATDVVYTITSTDSNDDKIILDMGSSNFTYSSVSVGTASKVGNTVECIGFTTNNPAVTIQFTAEATYSVTAKSVNIAGTYGDSASSSADSITIANWAGVVATGGTVTTDGDYKVHTFTGDGSFVVSAAGDVEYLVIAGGGGGGGYWYSGGGGAGGYRTATGFTVSSTSYSITVGAGGAGKSNNTNGDEGTDSIFSTITSTGGGGGASAGNENGTNGGSGGGGSGVFTPGTGAVGQGNDGGTSTGNNLGGCGGGGAGSAGSANSSKDGGAGGNGLASSITGSSITRAGGGGGADHGAGASGNGGAGGTGGGGEGGSPNNNPVNGSTNTGGGGGGLTDTPYGSASGNGGSGIVIIRYQYQ